MQRTTRILIVLALVGAMTSTVVATSEEEADAGPGRCLGERATIIATPGETTFGTNGDDVIVGTTGNDVILGRGGDDKICAGRGNDTVRAGGGNDRVQLGPGNDRAWGNGGNDVINGQGGNDTIRGGSGNDTLRGNGGSDRLFGNGGRDSCIGGAGRDTIARTCENDDQPAAPVRPTRPVQPETPSQPDVPNIPDPADFCTTPGDIGQSRTMTASDGDSVRVALRCFVNAAPPMFEGTVPAGSRLVAFELSLTNTSSVGWFGCAATRITLVDQFGAGFTPGFTDTALGPDFGCPTVLPGETRSGWVTIAVPMNRTPVLMRWEECCFEGDADTSMIGSWNL
ncbi:MAG: calcium-binding protein [Acidimicrobiales bacterium]